MKVTVLGSGAGIPLPGRVQSGCLVETEGLNILVDCGMGVPLRLAEKGIDWISIDLILLSHMHLDHIQALPTITKAAWLSSDQEVEYRVLCPPGSEDHLAGIWKAFGEYERVTLNFTEIEPGKTYESKRGAVEITPLKTEHKKKSQGYLLEARGPSLAYTGDTAPCSEFMEAADGVELLVHEVSLLQETDLHTTPDELIEMLEGMDVERLVITHFYPKVEASVESIAEDIQEATGIDTRAAEDLLEIGL